MAHQWFGNLVTMEWWTHLWLNEGFASFMENTCTADLYPEMDIWTQFVTDTMIRALELDALKVNLRKFKNLKFWPVKSAIFYCLKLAKIVVLAIFKA